MNWLVLIFALATSPLPDQATQWEIRIEELEGRMEMLESKLEALEARQPEFPKTAGRLSFSSSSVTTKRDPKQEALFKKDNPCPSTGKTTGACPNFVVDHPWSLCLGGPDIPANMRWQTNIEAQIKDVFERDMCAMKRKLEGK